MAEKVKHGVGHLGSSISNTIGSNVKNPFKKKTFDSDDELISQYQHDLKRSIKALKYILSQIHKVANGAVPQLFKSNMKSVELFGKLIGAESLHFEGIEEYYHQFDIMQAQQELPSVHPKEMDFEIPALNEQLYNYMVTLDKLASRTLDDWDLFYQENKLRVVEMCGYLNDTLKVIKKRNKKQYIYEKTHKKLEKLMKKTSPLDDKEQRSMASLEKELRDAKYIYEKIDERVRSILPHVYALLEEFVDSLSKILLCKQIDTYRSIHDTMSYFITYYGLMSDKERADDKSYDSIVDAWENAMTPVRLQIETFITIIHNKNPELIDEEIDDEDKTSKSSKMWKKMTSKITTKNFSLKPTDRKHGLFDGYLIADQLDAFLEYQNPSFNVSETYHPTKVPPKPTIREPVAAPKAPPLPPRQNTTQSPVVFSTPRFGAPISLPSSPVPSTPVSYNNNTIDSDLESVESDSIMSDVDDGDDDDDDKEDTSLLHAQSISTTNLLDDTKDRKNSKLMKVYNSSKNDIDKAPIYAPLTPVSAPKDNVFDRASSVTHKLDEFKKYFDKLDKLGFEPKTFTAQYDFNGEEPGDLSFKKGDSVDIIFTFYDASKTDRDTWSVGVVHNGQGTRSGLVPTNYF